MTARALPSVIAAAMAAAAAGCAPGAPAPSAPAETAARHDVGAQAAAASGVDANKPIGSAKMLDDGTLVLDLVAEGEGASHGIAQLRYGKDHPQYKSVLEHLGGMKPGEQKLVPPWPPSSPPPPPE